MPDTDERDGFAQETENEGESIPEEPSTSEEDASLNLDEDPEPAESGAQDQGEDEVPEDEAEEPESPATRRVKRVVDERNEVIRAAEAAGLVWDKETKQFLPKETGPEPDAEEVQWRPPEEARDSEVYTEEFWRLDGDGMAENATWQQVAKSYGFNPEEAVANEWATIKNLYARDLREYEAQRETQAASEQTAARDIQTALKALDADPEFAVSEKARAFVKAEVRRFTEQGYTPSQVKAILPGIQKTAWFENREDFIAAAVERRLREADGRKVLLGGQGGRSEGSQRGSAPNLTAAQMRAAKGMRMTPAEYAKFLGED